MNRRTLLAVLALVIGVPAQAAEKEGGGAKDQVTFVRLPVIQANILRSNRTRGVLTLENGVDVKDPKLRARVTQMQPRLRSAMARQVMLYAGNLSPGQPPNLEVLIPLLQKQVDLTLGGPGARLVVTEVLIN